LQLQATGREQAGDTEEADAGIGDQARPEVDAPNAGEGNEADRGPEVRPDNPGHEEDEVEAGRKDRPEDPAHPRRKSPPPRSIKGKALRNPHSDPPEHKPRQAPKQPKL